MPKRNSFVRRNELLNSGEPSVTERANKTPGIKKPPKRNPEKYLPPPFDRMPPLYPTAKAKDAAGTALRLMKQSYPELIGSEEDTYSALLRAGNIYWHGRVCYEQGQSDKPKAILKEIKQSAEHLKTLCANPRTAAPKQDPMISAEAMIWGLLNERLKAALNFNPNYSTLSDSPFANEPLRMIETILQDLSSACKKSAKWLPGRGNRPKGFIANGIEPLIGLWETNNKEFKFHFKTWPEGEPSGEVLNEGVRFVWQVMQAIDSNVQMGEVFTALKKISKRRPRKSGKST
jgi:hypothetical protein